MNETPQKVIQCQPANLSALHHHLKELATRTRGFTPAEAATSKQLQGPMIIVRGK